MANGVCELWLKVCERMGEVHGCPLPPRKLELGDPDNGWHAELDNSALLIPPPVPFIVRLHWNGWPFGVLSPKGGEVVVGDVANEATFRAWLPTAEAFTQ